MRKFLLAGLLQWIVVLAYCQAETKILATVDKSKILIGEQFQLTIELHLPLHSNLTFALPDSIEHFEILSKPRVDSFTGKEGKTIVQKYTLTSFDSGRWQIPAFALAKKIKSTPVRIDVVFSDFDPNQDYHSIKDIVPVELPPKKFPWWWIAIGVLLVLIFVYFFRKRKKTVPVAQAAVRTNPYNDAMQELKTLKKNKPEAKQFYTMLISIFRVYVYRKKGILSLQETTNELLSQLKNEIKEKERFAKLSEALLTGDAVKFAKYTPGNEDDEKTFSAVKDTISYIEQNERKHVV